MRLGRLITQIVIQLVKRFFGPVFVIEDLDDFLSVDQFFNVAVGFAQRDLLLAEKEAAARAT